MMIRSSSPCLVEGEQPVLSVYRLSGTLLEFLPVGRQTSLGTMIINTNTIVTILTILSLVISSHGRPAVEEVQVVHLFLIFEIMFLVYFLAVEYILTLLKSFQSRQKRTISLLNLLRIQILPTPILPTNFILINIQVNRRRK